tara:strand:+ start:4 stop:3642 length:3639 start_codon:yes stop_codon:yes gene_type:complete
MAEMTNVERNPYANQGGGTDNAIIMEEEEIEIVLPESEEELNIADFMEVVEDVITPYDHNENLVLQLENDQLDEIARSVIEGFEADKESRSEWESTFEKGFDLLGLKLRETSEPFEGACTAVHPLLIESAVKFQSKATQELFPSKGPVKAQIVGSPTPEKDKQANRVMDFMNYQLTDQMTEYFEELERMLFNLPVFGSAFKKTYWDMSYERPVSEFVPIDQFYVSNFAADLKQADRYTHVLYRSPNDLKRDIDAGMYTIDHYDDDGLPNATPVQPTPIKAKMNRIMGIEPNYDEEPQYTILEQHCYLEIETEDDENELTVALPYIVSIDEQSRKILCIRRNWREDDPRKEKLMWFTHYRFVPGFGFYGLGFIHFLGNMTQTATAALRNLIDAGQFANLPGGFKARGVRLVGDNDPIAPGEFKEVEATGIDLTKSIIPLPYKEPSQTLMQMLKFVADTGQKFADSTEQVIADSTNYGPVGTTLALLEASTKFFTAIHKRIHYSQRNELRILARINYDYLPDEYPYDIVNIEGKIFKSDFDGRVDILPVSDPNVPSGSHRLAMAQTVMQMAQQAPQGMYNLREVNRVMLDAAGIDHPERFLIPEQKAEPRDPISDINAASQGMPIKAFPGQDHDAHITVKQSFIADPTLGQNPVMQALVPILQANIREHMIMKYEEQMSGMLQAGIEQAGVGSEEAINEITKGAAQEILQNNQRMAEMGSVQDLERMTLDLQRQQLELEREKVKIDSVQSAAQIALDEQELELKKDTLELNAAEKVAKIKGVREDREIVAETKAADRDDKFLIEMMKMLLKETGATVDTLKEEVTLRPESFQTGGDTFFSTIGDYASQAGMSVMDLITNIFGGGKDISTEEEDVTVLQRNPNMPTEEESLIDITQSDTLDTPMKTPSEFMPNLSGQLTPTPVTSSALPPAPGSLAERVQKGFEDTQRKVAEKKAREARKITTEKLPPLVGETALDKQVREEKETAKSIVTKNQRDFENLQRRLSQQALDKQMKDIAKGKGPVMAPGDLQTKPPFTVIGKPFATVANAIMAGETGNENDPYIFTKVKGKIDKAGKPVISSAYGPAQITYTLTEDVIKNNKDTLKKDKGFENYLKKFVQQGRDSWNFEERGKVKRNGKWSNLSDKEKNLFVRGGKGNISQEEHKKYYMKLFELAVKEKIRNTNPQNAEELMKAWYGKVPNDSYRKRFNKIFKQTKE